MSRLYLHLIITFIFIICSLLCFTGCNGNNSLELTVVDQGAEFMIDESWFSVTVENTGQSSITYAEVKLEYYDNINENRTTVFTFGYLEPKERATSVKKITVDPLGEYEHFYFNLDVIKVE